MARPGSVNLRGLRSVLAAVALSCAARVCTGIVWPRFRGAPETAGSASSTGNSGRCMRPRWQLQRILERQAASAQWGDDSLLSEKVVEASSMWPFSSNKGGKEKDKKDAEKNTTEKVEIGFYYEVMCPYCKNLLNKSVIQLWNDTEFKQRIDIKFYPYGNAMALHKDTVSEGYKFWHEELNKTGFDYVFACQHGSEECFGNLIQTCAMELEKPKKYTPFILCMETYREGASHEMSSYDCATRLNIDMAPIRDCTRSKKGNKVMLKIAEATESLSPAHEYVPWVTLNGEHSEESEQDAENGEGNLLREVCDRLSEPKPSLCS